MAGEKKNLQMTFQRLFRKSFSIHILLHIKRRVNSDRTFYLLPLKETSPALKYRSIFIG